MQSVVDTHILALPVSNIILWVCGGVPISILPILIVCALYDSRFTNDFVLSNLVNSIYVLDLDFNLFRNVFFKLNWNINNNVN